MLSAALVDARLRPLRAPATRAERDGRGWVSSGEKNAWCPPPVARARILVPARDRRRRRRDLPGRSEGRGRRRCAAQRSSTGEPVFAVALAGARVDDAGPARRRRDGAAAVALDLRERARRPLRDAARRLRARARHDRALRPRARAVRRADRLVPEPSSTAPPIATSTSRRCAGRPGAPACASREGLAASRECAVAKFWAAEGGARIAAAASTSTAASASTSTIPIHRYFLRSKALELTLGGATPHLVRLGTRTGAKSGPAELA